MTKNTKLESTQKRDSLKLLKTAGVSSAVLASLGSSWMRPVVDQVILPAHAACTTDCCAGVVLSAEAARCSGDIPITVTVTSADGNAVIIDPAPTLSVSPTPNDWKVTAFDPTPQMISGSTAYTLAIAGSVENQDTCWPPMTDVPNGDPQLVTAITVSVKWTCVASGETGTLTEDILPMLSAPAGSLNF